MPMTPDEQQTAVRRSRWKGQHGQEITMAETLPDDEEDDDIDDEEDIAEEEIEEEDIEEEDDEEEES